MGRYKVTVCRFGYVTVEAESVQEARKQAECMPEQICWNGEDGQTSPFIVVYAETDEKTSGSM